MRVGEGDTGGGGGRETQRVGEGGRHRGGGGRHRAVMHLTYMAYG